MLAWAYTLSALPVFIDSDYSHSLSLPRDAMGTRIPVNTLTLCYSLWAADPENATQLGWRTLCKFALYTVSA